MSRKPIDQQQPSECRQAIWEWIKNHTAACPSVIFTAREMDIRLEQSSIRDYLTGLVNAGYLAATSGGKRGMVTTYILIKDCGHDAPRVRKDGSLVTQGQGQQYMWNAMRILKTFCAYDLALHASTDELTLGGGTALKYIQALTKAGYLVPKPDNRFMLVPSMWTGPQPPQIQRTKQVYDPNLRRVVWSRIEGGAE